MKIKTSITLSEELIRSIDELFGKQKNRSEIIEHALRNYIEKEIQQKRDLKDLEILNKKSDKFNREAEDVLYYQVDI
ncbi:MAG: ribbon-helix-helix protein, CopG family [Nitrospirae bacterium]|nr:ribbon-helix-helix protein, CopG family [Nitrospirota bacterium]